MRALEPRDREVSISGTRLQLCRDHAPNLATYTAVDELAHQVEVGGAQLVQRGAEASAVAQVEGGDRRRGLVIVGERRAGREMVIAGHDQQVVQRAPVELERVEAGGASEPIRPVGEQVGQPIRDGGGRRRVGSGGSSSRPRWHPRAPDTDVSRPSSARVSLIRSAC